MYPYGGGAELATFIYIKALVREGFKVTIVTTQSKFKLFHDTTGCQFKVFHMPIKLMRDTRYFTLIYSGALLKHSVEKLIKAHDVVYIPAGWYSVIPLAKFFRKKVVVSLHNYSLISPSSVVFSDNVHAAPSLKSFAEYELIEKRRRGLPLLASLCSNEYIGRYYNRLAFLADELICVSRRQAQIVSSFMPSLKGKIHVIYNPIPQDVLDVEKNLYENPTFLFAGGDSYIKGFYLLINLLKKLDNATMTRVNFIFTNNYGKEARVFLYTLKRRGVKLTIYGRVPREQYIKFCSQSWALLFPSIWEEPLPYVILESMSIGTVPVASMVGGVPEILESTFAEEMMFPPGSIDELIDRLRIILSIDREDLYDIGHKLRDAILKKINNEKIIRSFIQILQKN